MFNFYHLVDLSWLCLIMYTIKVRISLKCKISFNFPNKLTYCFNGSIQLSISDLRCVLPLNFKMEKIVYFIYCMVFFLTVFCSFSNISAN